MAENSKIEWTDATFNHVRGCTKISAGCAHCYAETLSGRNPKTLGVWGPKGTRVVAAESAWKEPVKWNRLAAEGRLPDGSPNPDGHRPRVFCASLADVFEDWPGPMSAANGEQLFQCDNCKNPDGSMHWQSNKPLDRNHYYECGCDEFMRPLTMDDVRRRLFDLIDATPNLDWLLVTKRPENVLRMWPASGFPDAGIPGTLGRRLPLPNVWLGVSVENQAAADERVPHLLRTPAAVRFLSCEPLLGPVDLSPWLGAEARCPNHPCVNHKTSEPQNVMRWATCMACNGAGSVQGVEWVIVGGEGGPGARPMAPAWARTLRDQCNAAGVAFFHKQNGEWWGWSQMSDADKAAVYNPLPPELEYHPDHRNHNPHVKPHQMVFSGGTIGVGESVYRVGKKAAGRLLDGRTWDEFPAAPATVGKE